MFLSLSVPSGLVKSDHWLTAGDHDPDRVPIAVQNLGCHSFSLPAKLYGFSKTGLSLFSYTPSTLSLSIVDFLLNLMQIVDG